MLPIPHPLAICWSKHNVRCFRRSSNLDSQNGGKPLESTVLGEHRDLEAASNDADEHVGVGRRDTCTKALIEGLCCAYEVACFEGLVRYLGKRIPNGVEHRGLADSTEDFLANRPNDERIPACDERLKPPPVVAFARGKRGRLAPQ